MMKRYHKGVVFVSAYLSLMLNDGLLYNMSVLFVDIMDTFKVTRAEGILVNTVMIAVTFASGIFSGAVIRRFGVRKAGVTGAMLAAAGLSVSYFAPNIIFLVFSISVCNGIGSSLVYIGGTSIVGEHFAGKHLSMVLSMLPTSTRLAGIGFPYLLIYLSDKLDLRGTFLICGGMLMNSVAFAMCWTPPGRGGNKGDTVSVHEPENKESSKDLNTISFKVEEFAMKDHNMKLTQKYIMNTINHISGDGHDIDSGHTNYNNCTVPTTDEDKRCGDVELKRSRKLNTSLFKQKSFNNSDKTAGKPDVKTIQAIKKLIKNFVFVGYVISTAINIQGILTFILFVGDIYKDKGFSEIELSRGLMIFNIVAVFGSLVPGILLKLPRLGTFSASILSTLCVTMGLCVLLLLDSYMSLMIAAAVIGLGFGMTGSFISVTTNELVDQKDFPIAFGILLSVASTTSLLSPALGYIRDKTDSYNTAIIVMLGLLVFSLFILATTQWKKYKQNKMTSKEITHL